MSDTIEYKLSGLRSSVFQVLDLMNIVQVGRNSLNARQAISVFFERNSDVTLIYLLSSENAQSSNYDERIVNEEFFASNEIETSLANDFVNQNCFLIERAILGESFANFPLVFKIRKIGEDSRQIPFEVKDENGKIHRYFVAYEKIKLLTLL